MKYNLHITSIHDDSGSAIVQVMIVIMFLLALLIALLSMNLSTFKKTLKYDSQYQAELCAQSAIHAVVQLLNETQDSYFVDEETVDLKIDFERRSQGNDIGTVEKATLQQKDNYIIVDIIASYNDQQVNKRGYIVKDGEVYQVKYYETQQ